MRFIFKLVFVFVLFVATATNAVAQLSFPKGKIVDTVIHVDLAYNETQLFFYTGKYKSSDYRYEKISDSLHPEWFVTACFNGECRNKLEDGGKFISELGINDTTCFIAFHVESREINGKSAIKYKVINSKDSTDQAVLEFYVTYVHTVGYSEKQSGQMIVKYFPNPASTNVNIATPKPLDMQVKVVDLAGKLMHSDVYLNTSLINLNTSHFAKGVYFVQLQNGKNVSIQKLIIE